MRETRALAGTLGPQRRAEDLGQPAEPRVPPIAFTLPATQDWYFKTPLGKKMKLLKDQDAAEEAKAKEKKRK